MGRGRLKTAAGAVCLVSVFIVVGWIETGYLHNQVCQLGFHYPSNCFSGLPSWSVIKLHDQQLFGLWLIRRLTLGFPSLLFSTSLLQYASTGMPWEGSNRGALPAGGGGQDPVANAGGAVPAAVENTLDSLEESVAAAQARVARLEQQ